MSRRMFLVLRFEALPRATKGAGEGVLAVGRAGRHEEVHGGPCAREADEVTAIAGAHAF